MRYIYWCWCKFTNVHCIYKCASTAKVQMCIAFNSFSLIFITVVVYLVLIIWALSGQFHCQMHPACLFSPAFRIFEFDCRLLWYLLIVPSLFTWYFGLFILSMFRGVVDPGRWSGSFAWLLLHLPLKDSISQYTISIEKIGSVWISLHLGQGWWSLRSDRFNFFCLACSLCWLSSIIDAADIVHLGHCLLPSYYPLGSCNGYKWHPCIRLSEVPELALCKIGIYTRFIKPPYITPKGYHELWFFLGFAKHSFPVPVNL